MTLKIIGAGYGRTGTASLKVALEMLGVGPCYHMTEVLRDTSRIDHWLRAADGQADWPATFEGYASTVDFPGSAFYRELAEFYPDAKVILSVRDADRWFDSVHETIMSPLMRQTLEGSPFGDLNKRIIWSRFDFNVDDRANMVECFNAHTEAVKRKIAADRLLIYEVKSGWEPLCDFLGLPIPDGPFPRVNTRDETKELIQQFLSKDGQGIDDSGAADAARRLHGDGKDHA